MLRGGAGGPSPSFVGCATTHGALNLVKRAAGAAWEYVAFDFSSTDLSQESLAGLGTPIAKEQFSECSEAGAAGAVCHAPRSDAVTHRFVCFFDALACRPDCGASVSPGCLVSCGRCVCAAPTDDLSEVDAKVAICLACGHFANLALVKQVMGRSSSESGAEGGALDLDAIKAPGCLLTPLELACRSGKVELVEYLLEECSASAAVGTAVLWAAYSANLDLCKLLVQKYGAAVDATNAKGEQAIHYAADKGAADIVGWLIDECGVPAGVKDGNGLHAGQHASVGQSPAHRSVEVLLITRGLPAPAGMFAPPGRCDVCSKEGDGSGGAVLRCARCKSAEYCGRTCQRSAWKSHKRVCKFFAEHAKPEAAAAAASDASK